MPIKKTNYQNGKIYKIWSLQTDKIYIGSTCDTLSNRLYMHKKSYNAWKQCKTNNTSSYILFDDCGIDNCKIELIKYCPCNTKLELLKEEGELIRLHKDNIVNIKIEGRTKKEYQKDNKDKINEQKRQLYEANKDKIKEQNKQYYEVNKEQNKEQKKQYYEDNKDKIKEKQKEYYKTKQLPKIEKVHNPNILVEVEEIKAKLKELKLKNKLL